MLKRLFLFSCVLCCSTLFAEKPSGLMTDLLEHTDRVWLDGYPSTISPAELPQTVERYQTATIYSKKPAFGWIVNDSRNDVLQTAYRILVGTDPVKLSKDEADLWDSGKVESDASVAVLYNGKELPPETVIYWKVKTWNMSTSGEIQTDQTAAAQRSRGTAEGEADRLARLGRNGDEQPFSDVKSFLTAEKLVDYRTARYPLQKTDQFPVKTLIDADGLFFADFGKAAFGRLRLTMSASGDNQAVTLHFGETIKDGCIDRKPGGTIRYASYPLKLVKGTHTYTVKFRSDKRNTGPAAIKMPDYIGEVYPFRYVEIEKSDPVRVEQAVREMVHYPFDDTAAEFRCSNDVVNQVWNLCKYSIKATSFAGVYVDGDRERIPYEADALINQLGHYYVDREFSMARYSHEYLLEHATWPTEWNLQSVLMAMIDYKYTGDIRSAEKFYDVLRAKTLTALADPETGLISTKTGKQTPEFLKSIRFNGKELRDIVDWPHTGILGLGKEEGGEADGYVFKDYNTVVNAFHSSALFCLWSLADATGKSEGQDELFKLDKKVRRSFNDEFFDANKGYYVDGIGTDHASLHANMFAMAFGLVPKEKQGEVMKYIRSRGMACSVYGSQFLMDAIYDAEDAEYGLKLLSSEAERSWYNMIRVGSTISMEAWDNKYKPNQDWNHAWGAVPANIIPRKLIGVEPIEPGFKTAQIRPQIAGLESAEARIPTIRGPIVVRIDKSKIDIELPANMKAKVILSPEKSQWIGSGKHSLKRD